MRFIPSTKAYTGAAQKLGHVKFTALMVSIVGVIALSCAALTFFLAPSILNYFDGANRYQACLLNYTGQVGAPGEVGPAGQKYPTDLTFSYCSGAALMVYETPAGNSDRATVSVSAQQKAKHPKILGWQFDTKPLKNPNLLVFVDLNYTSFASDKMTFIFTNMAAKMSADPKQPGYHQVQFVFAAVSEGVPS